LTAEQKVIVDYPIPPSWNPENCHAIAFIHYKGDSNQEVIQAIEAHIN